MIHLKRRIRVGYPEKRARRPNLIKEKKSLIVDFLSLIYGEKIAEYRPTRSCRMFIFQTECVSLSIKMAMSSLKTRVVEHTFIGLCVQFLSRGKQQPI